MSQEALPSARDVKPISAAQLVGAEVFASVADLLRGLPQERILVAGMAASEARSFDRIPKSAEIVAMGKPVISRALLDAGYAVVDVGPGFLESDRSEASTLVYVGASVRAGLLDRLIAYVMRSPNRRLCVSNYALWTAGARNDTVRLVNRFLHQTPTARVAAYILDPGGEPLLVVGSRS